MGVGEMAQQVKVLAPQAWLFIPWVQVKVKVENQLHVGDFLNIGSKNWKAYIHTHTKKPQIFRASLIISSN